MRPPPRHAPVTFVATDKARKMAATYARLGLVAGQVRAASEAHRRRLKSGGFT